MRTCFNILERSTYLHIFGEISNRHLKSSNPKDRAPGDVCHCNGFRFFGFVDFKCAYNAKTSQMSKFLETHDHRHASETAKNTEETKRKSLAQKLSQSSEQTCAEKSLRKENMQSLSLTENQNRRKSPFVLPLFSVQGVLRCSHISLPYK